MKRHQYISPEKILTGERCAGQRVKDGGKPEEIEKGKMKLYLTFSRFIFSGAREAGDPRGKARIK